MKLKLLMILLFLGVTTTVVANDEFQINQIVAMVKSMGQFKEMSKCTGAPESKVEKEYKTHLAFCVKKTGNFDSDEMDQCFVDRMSKVFGMSKSDLESCAQEEEQVSETEQALDDIYNNIGEEGITPEQEKEINRLQAALIKENQQVVNEVIEGVAAANQGTEKLVTLPVYKNSRIMGHLFGQGQINLDGKAYTVLPAATFATSDSVDKVVAFYKKKLPNFDYKEYQGSIIFMEKMPKDFDMLKNMQDYVSTPHVTISKSDHGVQSTASKTMIEITYRKK